jgi:hypothetical protein
LVVLSESKMKYRCDCVDCIFKNLNFKMLEKNVLLQRTVIRRFMIRSAHVEGAASLNLCKRPADAYMRPCHHPGGGGGGGGGYEIMRCVLHGCSKSWLMLN